MTNGEWWDRLKGQLLLKKKMKMQTMFQELTARDSA